METESDSPSVGSMWAILPLSSWALGIVVIVLLWIGRPHVTGESGFILLSVFATLAVKILFVSGMAGSIAGYFAIRRSDRTWLAVVGLIASLISLALGTWGVVATLLQGH